MTKANDRMSRGFSVTLSSHETKTVISEFGICTALRLLCDSRDYFAFPILI